MIIPGSTRTGESVDAWAVQRAAEDPRERVHVTTLDRVHYAMVSCLPGNH